MKRRDFITLLGGAAATWPFVAAGQHREVPGDRSRPLITFLATETPKDFSRRYSGLLDGLRQMGWLENRDFEFALRSVEGDLSKLPSAAAELVRLKPNVIVATVTAAGLEARKASQDIPIVVPQLIEPVALGLAHSLAKPGMNVTGILSSIEGLLGKQLEILREIAPPAVNVGVLINPRNPQNKPQLQELIAASGDRGIRVIPLYVPEREKLGASFSELAQANADGLVVLPDPMFFAARTQIASLAIRNRVPVIYSVREHAEDGGLVSYAINRRESYYRAATFVDKILKGAKPGDLPIELPTKLELVVNLTAARSIGIKVPETFLVRADEVIE